MYKFVFFEYSGTQVFNARLQRSLDVNELQSALDGIRSKLSKAYTVVSSTENEEAFLNLRFSFQVQVHGILPEASIDEFQEELETWWQFNRLASGALKKDDPIGDFAMQLTCQPHSGSSGMQLQVSLNLL